MNWRDDIGSGMVITFGWLMGTMSGGAWYWFPVVFVGWMCGAAIYGLVSTWRTHRRHA